MNNDQLSGLLALKVLAEKKNFTSAAKVLRISTSALSQSIKQLESRFGVALLSRTTRSVSLTEAGEQFLSQTKPALEQILAAITSIKDYAKKPKGTLKINLPRIVYPSYLAKFLVSFHEKFPEIIVQLHFEDGREEIFSKGFDAGIRLSDILAKDVTAIKLFGPVKFITLASPSYLEKFGRPKHPKDLLNHNCILQSFGNNTIYNCWEFEQKGKAFEVEVKGNLIMNDSTLATKSAIDGVGVIYSTEDAVSNYIKSGELEIILEQYSCSSSGFYLYYPRKDQVLPKLRAFIDHVKEFNSKNSNAS